MLIRFIFGGSVENERPGEGKAKMERKRETDRGFID